MFRIAEFLLEQPNHPLVGKAYQVSFLSKSSLGDAQSSLGDAKSSLGDAKSSLGDAPNFFELMRGLSPGLNTAPHGSPDAATCIPAPD